MSTPLSKKIDFSLILIGLSFLFRALFLGMHNLFVEEAYYWNYAMHLDFGYLDHPPMVALLIKCSTLIFGTNEFAVRCMAMVCWLVTAYFSFKLSTLIRINTGKYAIMLLAILPFFVVHSLVITPDLPLMVAWSATLYFLYRALIQHEIHAWYFVGLWLGIGMISKYTIALLGFSTLIYVLITPSARHLLKKKEPYLGALIALFVFSPVIYWNATHEWASFAFQSTRRLNAQRHFSLHALIGLFILFLTPVGVMGFIKLFKTDSLDKSTQRFMQIYVLTPLFVFALFSLTHGIKFNWIGPVFLAIIPWLSIELLNASKKLKQSWQITAYLLFIVYVIIFSCIDLGPPHKEIAHLMTKNIAWKSLTTEVNQLAEKFETDFKKNLVIIPLDAYNISSELTFYQAKLLKEGKISHQYKTIGANIFGIDSLMYRYWTKNEDLSNKIILLISNHKALFDSPGIDRETIKRSPILKIIARTQGQNLAVEPYYYQVVELKT